jgi:uncharacterized membrane protein
VFSYPLNPVAAWALALVSIALVVEAARRARWNAPVSEHLVWAIATAAVLLGHRMTVTLPSGLQLHYLGSGFLALLLGYPRAILSMAAVLAIDGAIASSGPIGGEPQLWGLRMLLAGALPVWTMWLVVSASKRWLPRNPFVFLLGCGLLGLFFAYAVQLAASAIAFVALAPSVPRELLDDFVPYALLLASGEAWLEGMLTTLLVVYLPGGVRLFDEGFYLKRR